jgi:hypothetical protein
MIKTTGPCGKGTRQKAKHCCTLLILTTLALGFVTTIGVAWTFAYRTRLNSGARVFGAGFSELIVLKTGNTNFPGMHYRRLRGVECYDFWPGPGSAAFLAARNPEMREVSASNLPSWVYLRDPSLTTPSAPTGVAPSNVLSYAFGWPWPTMRGLIIEFGSNPPTGRDFLWLTPQSLRIRGLPLSPVWPGFAINWLLFTVIWFVLWRLLAVPVQRAVGAVLFRGRNRRKRGHCPACGYDLLNDFGKGCPECGWAREKEGLSC